MTDKKESQEDTCKNQGVRKGRGRKCRTCSREYDWQEMRSAGGQMCLKYHVKGYGG